MRSNKGFTIIEIMVAILVFTVGLLGAYALVKSAMSLSLRSKQEILSANIIREQIELVKNIRDTNYLALRKWNSLGNFPSLCTGSCEFTPGYYTIENNYDASSPIRLNSLGPTLDAKSVVVAEANNPRNSTVLRLCIDDQDRYTHQCNTSMKRSPYYSYFKIEPVKTGVITVPNAFTLTAYFATTEGGYREFSMYTILTDWKK